MLLAKAWKLFHADILGPRLQGAQCFLRMGNNAWRVWAVWGDHRGGKERGSDPKFVNHGSTRMGTDV